MKLAVLLASAAAIAACSLAVSESDYIGGRSSDGGVAPGDDSGERDAGTDVEGGSSGENLVAAWSFEGLAANDLVKDTTGHGHDGRLGGDAGVETSGFDGGSLVLRGGLDAMFVESLEATAFPRTGTLSIHVKYDFDGTDQRGIIENFAASEHLFFRRAGDAPPNEFQVAYQSKNTAYVFDTTFTLARNVWSHVVFTWSETASVGTVYLDGTLVRTAAYEGAPWAPAEQVFRIGDNFIGAVDELRLYDVAKSEDEIKAIP